MSVESPGQDEHWLHHWRLRFRAWRGGRPFWAGMFVILGGSLIGYLPYHNFQMGSLAVRIATTAGAGAAIIGILLVTLGLTLWFQQIVRVFAGVASIVLALVSIPISNIGGLVVGFMLAMTGGALAIAWAPGAPAEESATEPEGPQGEDPDEAYVPGSQLLPGAAPEPADRPEQPADPEADGGHGRSSATISVTKAPGGGQYA